jgi:hypothetical protein
MASYLIDFYSRYGVLSRCLEIIASDDLEAKNQAIDGATQINAAWFKVRFIGRYQTAIIYNSIENKP